MNQPLDQHWAFVLNALESEATKMQGTGSSTVRIRFHQGQPREIEVLQSKQKYLIAKGGTVKGQG